MSKPMNHHEFMITMAMDAFRLCIGNKPRNHSLEDVIRWMRLAEIRRIKP